MIPLSCRHCFKNKVSKATIYRCSGCLDSPPLCPGCFKSWHDAKNYCTSRKIIHWPEAIPHSIPLNCRQCYKKSCRKESSFRCSGCPGGPPLCPECFFSWHK